MSRVVLLTGGRGVGKTTVCRQTVRLARRRGDACGGILTLSQAGARDVLDVGSGRRRRLTAVPGGGRAVTQGRFRFDPRILRWGRRTLSQATPCDLLVVDEVGPLEIERGEGWAIAFDVLEAGAYVLALLVVRPELIVRAQDRLTTCATRIVAVARENRDRLPASLVAMMEEEVAQAPSSH